MEVHRSDMTTQPTITIHHFRQLLTEATAAALDCARQFVENELPDVVIYHVFLNQSHDADAEASFRVYPEDDGKQCCDLNDHELVTLLFRDGRCPVWIDIAAEAVGTGFTRMELLCAGRYSEHLERMYYTKNGTGPFGIKGPYFPAGYVEGAKFLLKPA